MTRRGSSKAATLLLGLAILTFGVILLLDNLNLWPVESGLRLWFSGLLFALGVLTWRHSRLAGALLVLLGSWSFLGELFGFVPWNFELLWPLIFVFLGLNMIWQALTGAGRSSDTSDSRFTTVAVWSGVGRKVSSPDFVSGEAVAVMGGCTVDLRESFIAEGVAEIFVFAMWGAVEILVPEDWSVTSKGIPFMGGFEDATRPPRGGSQQRLIVRGAAVMGGAGISNHEESES